MKVLRQVFLAALLIGFFQESFAQTPTALDTTSASRLLTEARGLFDAGKYKEAEKHAERAYNFFQKAPDSAPNYLAEAAYQRGRALFAQKKYRDAQPFFSRSLEVLAAVNPNGSIQESVIAVLLGKTFHRLGKYDDAIGALKKALMMQEQFLPENHPDYADALRQMGQAHLGKSTYAGAIPYLEKSLRIYKTSLGERSETFTTILEKLAQAYLYNGNYREAITSLEKTLAIQQQILTPNHPNIAQTYMTMGAFQKYMKRYDEALFYFNKAREIQQTLNEGASNPLAACYSQIGQVYLYKKDFKTALGYFLQEDSIMIRSGENEGADYQYTCSDLGKAYLALGNYPEAVRWQNMALAVAREASETDNTNIATLTLYLGRAQLGNGQIQDALASFRTDERILKQLCGADCNILYHCYAEMGFAYAKWYLSAKQDSLLDQSRHFFQLAEKGIEKLIREEPLAEARQKVLFESLPYFERAIATELLYLKAKPGDVVALERAWQLSEAMHSYLLFSSTQEAKARQFAGIPDAELRRDSVLRWEIAALGKWRNSLIQNQGLSLTDSLVLALNISVSDKKEEHAKLCTFFEKNYPDYYRLKYERQTSPLAKTRQLLAPQQTLLEYFTGDSSIFVFVVQREGSRVLEIKRDFPLNEWAQALREGISGYHTVEQKTPGLYQKTVGQYADAAQKLYEKLVAPIAQWLTPELVIVPSEILAGLPFEALLSAAPKDLSNFKTYPFLLRKHSVHYAYSATMLDQMTARKHKNPPMGGLLAFAPFFEEDEAALALRLAVEATTRLGLLPLPFSGEEVFSAKKHYGEPSEVLVGKNATKQRFLELATRYKILHLATHGKANRQVGDFSFLAFSAQDASWENSLLSVSELYNVSLNAELVLLSACETSLGEQQRGEGVVSLARAFAYAGARSIVASLWSVNDKSTMLVMDNFYKEINLGNTKNVSLTNAKRTYLEQNPGQPSHPFFWAGFVAVGDMSAIKH